MENNYIFENVKYNPNLCDSRKWKNDRSPYHQCQNSKKINGLCVRCYNKQLNGLLWEGLITKPPPSNPICVTKNGTKTPKVWLFNNDHLQNNNNPKNIYNFDNYEEIMIDNNNYKLNTSDNTILNTKSGCVEILGIWDKNTGKITKR